MWLSLLANWRAWAGVGIVGVAVFGYIQHVRLSSCQAELLAATERLSFLADKLKAQNEAVAALEETAQRRQAEAAAALLAQRERSTALKTQVGRLQGALASAKPLPAGSCQAGEALKEVRRALSGR